nr:ribonuclease H-like domain-containing protein [Tanacetum cinerariifolium]
CPVTNINTKDHIRKFNGKADEGFYIGYSLNSKAFRVFNSRTRFIENTPNVVYSGPDWLFDIDSLTRTMNYEPNVACTRSSGLAGTKASDNAGQARTETEPVKDYVLLPLWTADSPFSQDPKRSQDDGFKPSSDNEKKVDENPRKENECKDQEKEDNVNSTNKVNTASSTVNAAGTNDDNELPFDPNMPALEDVSIFNFSNDDRDDDIMADMNNIDTTIQFWSTAMAKTNNREAQIHAWVDGKITDLFPCMLVQNPMGEGSAIPMDPQHTPTILQPSSSQPQKTQKPRKPNRKDTQVPQLSVPTESVAYEAVYKESDDSLVRAATTASSLEAEQDNGNILQSDEDRMKLNELMELCTNLQSKVLDLEKTKTTQALEITSLKRSIKKLEKKQKSRTYKLNTLYMVGLTATVDSSKDEQSLVEDASKQRRKINDIDADEDITLVNDQDDAKMFDVNDLHGEEVFVEKEVANKEVSATGEVNSASIATIVSDVATVTTKEITLAQALMEIKTSKPKVKGIVLQEPSESITTITTISSKKSSDKGKAGKPKKKVQLMIDKETAKNLQDEFDEEERIAREKTENELEANIALIKEWDDIKQRLMLIINWLKDYKRRKKKS